MSIMEAIDHYKCGINYDIFKEPVISYAKLAIDAMEKQIPKPVVFNGYDESDSVHCPCCDTHIGCNEIIYENFIYRNFTPMHCQECGQAMVWR